MTPPGPGVDPDLSDEASTGDELSLRWWQYVGPWPIRPLPVTIFASLFFAFTVAAAAILENSVVADVDSVSHAISVAAGALVVWVLLWIARRWERHHPLTLTTYLLIFLVVGTCGVVVRAIVGQVADILLSTPVAFVSTALRVAIPLAIINSILGVSTARLQNQVRQTQAALAVARRQQDRVLQADEQARRQVADTLHDQVQASLIACCLQLQATQPSDRSGIDAVIDRLEELRKIDVRRAARTLSPTLSEIGLSSSLAELASQYEPGMMTVISVDPVADAAQSEVDERTRLGCYRIVEQALLNAAIHGQARNCEVIVRQERGVASRDLVLIIDDDGLGFTAETPEPGSGSALISTWVLALSGEWRWISRPHGGIRLHVRFPVPAGHPEPISSHM